MFVSVQAHCQWRQPSGKEIYRRSNISVFEVDGRDHKVRNRQVEFINNKKRIDHHDVDLETGPESGLGSTFEQLITNTKP